MLVKHIVRYAPSILVPAFSAFGALFFYTRLLTPDQFGQYTLMVNAANLLMVVVYYWLQMSLPRLLPQAAKQGAVENLSTTGYAAFAVLSLLMCVVAFIYAALGNSHEVKFIALLAIPLTLSRGVHGMNLIIHRNAFSPFRYGLLECGQAIIGLIMGLVLVYFFNIGGSGAILGLVIGYTLTWLADYRTTLRSVRGHVEPAMLHDMMIFGLPLVFSYGFAFVLAASDRFFIEYFCGPSAVGIYSAGYNLVERTLTVIAMLAVLPSYTLTVHKLEHESASAAREQIYNGGVALLALMLPSCAGLIVLRAPLASLAIGSAFLAGALPVMPWIAIAALLGGVTTHYFNQAFNLAKKSTLLVIVQLPAAIISIGGNWLLIPHFGIMGAAYSSVLSYAVLCALSIFLGRRAFVLPFPFKPAVQICLSVLAMVLILWLLPQANSVTALAVRIILGGAVYGAGLVAFNVLEIRSHLTLLITTRMQKR